MSDNEEFFEDDTPPATPRGRVARPGVARPGVARPGVARPSAASQEGSEEKAKPRAPRPAAGQVRGGWSAGKELIDSTSTFAQAFKPEAQLQIIKFIDDQPYANYARHWVERMGQGGKKTNRPYACPGSVGRECPICDIGDRPQTVSSFNIALVADDGTVSLKTWDVGVKIFKTLQAFANDARIAPLNKDYFAVSRTGTGGSANNTIIPVKTSVLEEDYGVEPISPEELERIGRYDIDVVTFEKQSVLAEIAAEIAAADEV